MQRPSFRIDVFSPFVFRSIQAKIPTACDERENSKAVLTTDEAVPAKCERQRSRRVLPRDVYFGGG